MADDTVATFLFLIILWSEGTMCWSTIRFCAQWLPTRKGLLLSKLMVAREPSASACVFG